ncbi:hypothetical protein TGRUB_270020, partial [Toxoplasma gondii RUB]
PQCTLTDANTFLKFLMAHAFLNLLQDYTANPKKLKTLLLCQCAWVGAGCACVWREANEKTFVCTCTYTEFMCVQFRKRHYFEASEHMALLLSVRAWISAVVRLVLPFSRWTDGTQTAVRASLHNSYGSVSRPPQTKDGEETRFRNAELFFHQWKDVHIDPPMRASRKSIAFWVVCVKRGFDKNRGKEAFHTLCSPSERHRHTGWD